MLLPEEILPLPLLLPEGILPGKLLGTGFLLQAALFLPDGILMRKLFLPEGILPGKLLGAGLLLQAALLLADGILPLPLFLPEALLQITGVLIEGTLLERGGPGTGEPITVGLALKEVALAMEGLEALDILLGQNGSRELQLRIGSLIETEHELKILIINEHSTHRPSRALYHRKRESPMKERTYIVETPEQLRVLDTFVKIGSAQRLASVWSANRRRAGRCSWDGNIQVYLCTDSLGRHAWLMRPDHNGEPMEEAELRYNHTLRYCQDHLQEANI